MEDIYETIAEKSYPLKIIKDTQKDKPEKITRKVVT